MLCSDGSVLRLILGDNMTCHCLHDTHRPCDTLVRASGPTTGKCNYDICIKGGPLYICVPFWKAIPNNISSRWPYRFRQVLSRSENSSVRPSRTYVIWSSFTKNTQMYIGQPLTHISKLDFLMVGECHVNNNNDRSCGLLV